MDSTPSPSSDSNYLWESLLEVIRKNIAWWCHQTFENKKFVDNSQKCFAFTPQVNFPDQFEFSLKVKVMGSNPGYLLKSFLVYLEKKLFIFNIANETTRLYHLSFTLLFYVTESPRITRIWGLGKNRVTQISSKVETETYVLN